jgi:hypothetical protein
MTKDQLIEFKEQNLNQAKQLKGSSGPTLEFKPGMQPDGQLKDLPGGNKKGLNLGIGKTLSKAAEVIGTPAAAALFAADTVRGNIAKGQSLTDAVVDPMVGAELLFPSIASKAAPGVMKGILGLGKVGRAFTPVGAALTVAGQGQEFYNQLKELQRLKEEDPEAYETFMDSRISDPLTAEEQMQIEDMGREGAMYGGRMGFDKGGPSNKDRRKFMKVVGGLATLPIFGKYFKLGEKAATGIKVLSNTTTTMPEWFPSLVEKFIAKGIGKKIDQDLMEYTTKDLPDVKMIKKSDGTISVEGKNDYNEDYFIQYEPPKMEVIDEATGKAVKTKGEFVATDTEYRMVSPDDYDIDGVTVDNVDELLGGSSNQLEGFAKGTGEVKYTTGQRRVDEAGYKMETEEGKNLAGSGSSKEFSYRADINDPYKDMDPTDFLDD